MNDNISRNSTIRKNTQARVLMVFLLMRELKELKSMNLMQSLKSLPFLLVNPIEAL